MCSLCANKKLTVCVTNFDHHLLISLPFRSGGAYFTDGKFSCHISFLVFTFCRLLDFSQKLNMTFIDFQNTQSDHSVTKGLFKYGLYWKLSKNYGFHRSLCKMQVIYGNMTPLYYTLFQNQIHVITGNAQFLHFMVFSLSKIVIYGM